MRKHSEEMQETHITVYTSEAIAAHGVLTPNPSMFVASSTGEFDGDRSLASWYRPDVAIAGRRTTFERLGLAWIAACGAVGGALRPFVSRAVLCLYWYLLGQVPGPHR